jgi:uncharacterized RDD family membrane protein YckC
MDKYETLWRRFIALFIDFIILIPVNWGIAIVLSIIDILPTLLTSALTGLVSVLYYVLMHFYYGRTVGKMVGRVKVLDDSETPLNFGQSVLRSLPQLLPVMFAFSFSTADETAGSIALWAGLIYGFTGLFSIADVIVCLANDKRRALHDFIAGTIVVRTDV